MPATFLDLPPELQLLINDFILPTDLRTHVCFFLSDPRCISFYSSRPDSERFWSVLCWNDGLGQLADGMETQATWCDIAVSVISRDGFCTHPQCGEALLDHNRARMQEIAQGLRPSCPIVFDDDYGGEMYAIIHRIFGHIDFRSGDEVNLRNEPSIYRDAHLRPASHVKPATTKPRQGIYFAAPPDSTELRNVYPDGVICLSRTVRHSVGAFQDPLNALDMLELIQLESVVSAVLKYRKAEPGASPSLDNNISVRDTLEYVMAYEDCLGSRCTLPMQLLRCLRTTRDILTVCNVHIDTSPIQGLELEEYVKDGPAFSLDAIR